MSSAQPRRKTSMKSNRQSFAPKTHTPSEGQLPIDNVVHVERYSSADGAVSLPVRFDGETVWATQVQMAEMLGSTVPNINMHLKRAADDGELDGSTIQNFLMVRREGVREVARRVQHYNLDAIISVGYRVHSPRGVHFRRWATSVLRQRILDQNVARVRHVDAVADLLATSSDEHLASLGRIMQRYTGDFDRLADHDRGELVPPTEVAATERMDLEDVELIVAQLRERFPNDERLGVTKDDSIHGVLGQIDQTFMGQELYPSAQEKAANLLYMIVKDHPFGDGNKRTGAALFAY
ncbi:hypothetical protein J2Y46_001085 [Microbacterium sp. BE35]|uniref:virulence protein RhuM/Fic/DOC family protein n=1 Tax=Microbacterium sp. BE35 TaxID=2817773 RepID=UPI002861C4B9|nr:virulence protein RhuM/Fic/DOC family protein [Microbacterium sp. BE35]MDR7188269.1 hypothetical protein [Microbacterium sp. BE35]